jgi:error-prone DNA polymerase
VRFARPEGRRLLDAFCCLREKTSLDRAGRRLLPNGEHYLVSPEEMAARFADRPEWIRATRAIAERCTFTLENLGYRFPCFPVPPGASQASWLRRLTFEGARKRYGSRLSPRVRAQLEHELAVIEKLDLPGYFLIVHDIARFAREEGILVQGRSVTPWPSRPWTRWAWSFSSSASSPSSAASGPTSTSISPPATSGRR